MPKKRNVYKKSSNNGKLVVYLASRDIFDDLESVDPIEGVIILDKEFATEKGNVYARITCDFRYGREDLDEIMSGVIFRKEFHLQCKKLFPPQKEKSEQPLSDVQNRLMQKFEGKGYPFRFHLPHDIPASVMLQSGEFETPDNHPCGVMYALEVFFGIREDQEINRQHSVKVVIRRLSTASVATKQAVPRKVGPSSDESSQLTSDTAGLLRKKFQTASGNVKIEGTLPKDVFTHTETITLDLLVDNLSSNSIKRIKVQIIQMAEVTIFKPAKFRNVIQEININKEKDNIPIAEGQTGWCHAIELKPGVHDNHNVPGLALDGKIKNEESNLATSTLIKDYRKKDQLGVVVQYLIRVKAITGIGSRDVELEVPFHLLHARPEDH